MIPQLTVTSDINRHLFCRTQCSLAGSDKAVSLKIVPIALGPLTTFIIFCNTVIISHFKSSEYATKIIKYTFINI